MAGVNGGKLTKGDFMGEGNILITATMDPQAKKAITDFLGSLNQIVKGDKLGQYFDNLSNVSSKFAASLQRFKKESDNIGFAKSLVNDFNALEGIAQADGKKLQDVLKGIAGGYDSVMQSVERAKTVAGSSSFDGITAKAVQDFVTSGRVIEEWGANVKRIIEGVTLNTSTEELQTRIRELNEALAISNTEKDKAAASSERYRKAAEQAAEAERRMKETYNETFYGDEYQELASKAEKYNEVVQRNVEEVKRFIEVSKLGTFDQWRGLNEAVDYNGIRAVLDTVERGSMDASTAIVRLKEDYGSLIDLSSTKDIGEDKIRHLESAVQETVSIVRELKDTVGNAGFGSSDGHTVLDRALGDSEEIRGDTEALRAAQNVVVNLLNSFAAGGNGVETERTAISGLVAALKELATVDVQGLTLTSDILRRLPNMANIRVNTDQMDNLSRSLKSLAQLSKDMDFSALTTLTNVNLSGFSNLSVSKASMSNLATYLPQITGSNVDIDKLRELTTINLSNFNKENLSVSAASFKHLQELLAQIQGKPVQTVNNGQTQQLSEEEAMVERLNTTWRTHSEAVAKAIEDEQRKSIISTELTAKLQHEREAMDAVSGSAERGAASGQKYSAVLDKMVLGKFVAEFSKVKAQFDALEDKPAKLAENMRKLESAEKEMHTATNMKDRVDAYERFTTILDVVRTQIGAVNAEARNSNADFKGLLNMVKQAGSAMDGIANSSFTNKLKEMSAKAKGIADESVIRNLKEMRQAYVDMQSAYGTTGPNTERDYQALINAQIRWKAALNGLNQALSTNRAESAAVNAANREAAQTVKAIADGAATAEKQIAALNSVFEGLRDKTKFDTSSFDQMRALLDVVNNTSMDTSVRQSALQQLNDLIKQNTDSLNQLAAAEKAEAAAKKQSDSADKQKAALIKQLNQLLVQCTNAEQRYAIVSKAAFAKENYQGIKDTKTYVQQLLQQLNGTNPKLDEIAAGANKAQTAFSNFNTSLRTNGGLLGNWLSTGMSQLKSRLSYTFGLAAMVYKTVGEIKKMISTAVELDSAMNTLQIVTRSSGAEMEAYGKRVSSMAKETAQATKDLIDATTVYARLGYSMDESAVLSKYTAMLEGVGGIEASAAQDAVTAIIKAFGKNVNDIEDVMNKLVLVGNNFPISVSQLAEGMNNAGSMLAVAGNSFEQSIALLTAANTTIQNISKASTGLRTIAARIRKTTTGEGDDGEIVEEAKYQEMVNALTKQHVSLVDEVTGQYRSTYDIIRDIAGVWKNMTSMEQAAVVEALAGTRQQNIFASLMTQFGEAEDAMKRMDNSAGELQESYDIYLGSIQAHVQTLKAAFDELSVDFLDSGFAKGVIDALTKIVEALDWVISKIGTFGTIIAAVGLPIIARNFEKIAVAVSKVFKAIFLSKGFDGLLVMSTAAEKLSAVMTSLAGVAPVLVPLLAAFAAAAVAAKVIDGKSFESASAQVAQTKAELDKLEEQQTQVVTKWNELNDAKAHGDFTTQQETELTLLSAQKDVLKAQVDLLKDRYEWEKAHERDAAREAVGRLLADAGDRNGYSTAQAVAAYRDAKQQYNKGNIFGKKSVGAKNNLDAANKILEGQLQTYQNALKVLNPEEDAELIAQIKDDILEITSAVSDIPIEVLRARSELEKIQQGGKVKLLNRPVIDANILEAAGWGEFEDGEGATVFSSTYSNEDGTVAMNFTPIIVDKDGNYVGAFTPEQLQQYAEAVIAGTQEDTLGLKIGATFEGSDAIKQATAEAEKVHELHELVYEQDLKKIRKFHNDVKTLSSGTLDAVKKYVKDGTNLTKDQAQELQGFLDRYKYSGETFAQMFSQMFAEAPDGLSQSIEKSTADLAGFHDELVKANEALARYKKYMEGGEKDDAVKEAAEIYKGALEDIQSGRVDTNRLHAAAELFLGKDRLKQLGYDIEAVAKELQGSVWQYLFDPNDESEIDYGQRFAEYVRQNLSEASGVWVEGGNTFFYKNLQSVADAFHMSTDAASMFISALDMYGVNVMRSVDDTAELIERFKTLKSELGSTGDAIYQVVSELHADGYDDFEIYEILERLQQAGAIDLNRDQLYASIDEALGKIDELEKKEAEPTTDLNYEPFTASYNAVVDLMTQLNSMTANPTVIMDYAERHVSDSDTKRNSNTSNNTQSAAGIYSKAGAGADAGGKQPGRNGGDTLVNELGPELISDRGRAFIANGGRPGFVYLSDDAIVFTADETKDILRGKRNVNGKALAQGNVNRGSLIGRLVRGGVHARSAYVNCWKCGTRNLASRSTCFNCGASLSGVPRYSRQSADVYGQQNAGVNRSGYGSPTASNTQNMGGNGYYYNPSNGNTYYALPNGNGTSTIITYHTTTSESSIAQAQWAENIASITAQLKRDTEQLKAENAALKAKAAAAQGYNTTPKATNSGSGSGYAGTGGGNNVGGADYASAADPQKVDWVAVRINRLQRTIADLEKVATSGFKALEKRLTTTKDQIAKTTEEIKVMDQAYNRYIQEANSVGLDSGIAEKVKNGTIDISKYDDDTRKKIDEYTEW